MAFLLPILADQQVLVVQLDLENPDDESKTRVIQVCCTYTLEY